MRLQKWSPHRRVISTAIVLVVLTLPVSIFPASATDRDNIAIRIYEALSAVDTATTEHVYMTGTGDSMYPTIKAGDNVKVQFYTNGSVIDVGDIIVYHAWTIGVYIKCMWIGHRVIEKYKEGDTWYFRTKGDNCPDPDNWEVPEYAMLGKIVSIEHTERSYVPTKTSSQTERAQTAHPGISLPEGSETFLLIAGSFCLGAILAMFDNLKRRKQKNILKRVNVYSCYSCRYYQIQYTYRLESIYGRIGIRKAPDFSRGFCRCLNPPHLPFYPRGTRRWPNHLLTHRISKVWDTNKTGLSQCGSS